MKYRTFGRLGWQVSDMGYGMWGLGGWTGSDDAESLASLERAVALGCNFFDTALAYGAGHSEQLPGQLARAHPDQKLYLASKIPPQNGKWPSRPEFKLDDTFPPDHIRQCVERSLKNLGQPSLDLIQFHVWEDGWADDARWQRALDDLKREGLVKAAGISINRWEPENALRALRTGAIDAVQVIYNIFDQAPEDQLFPLCRELGVAVIARVPFDEGSLTGTLTRDSHWPAGMNMPEMALRFILANPDVSTIIPGMRKLKNVEANIAASDAGGLDADFVARLRPHRWDRQPTSWSQ